MLFRDGEELSISHGIHNKFKPITRGYPGFNGHFIAVGPKKGIQGHFLSIAIHDWWKGKERYPTERQSHNLLLFFYSEFSCRLTGEFTGAAAGARLVRAFPQLQEA